MCDNRSYDGNESDPCDEGSEGLAKDAYQQDDKCDDALVNAKVESESDQKSNQEPRENGILIISQEVSELVHQRVSLLNSHSEGGEHGAGRSTELGLQAISGDS